MIVCHDPKFVYYAPPKTGTTSLFQMLRTSGYVGKSPQGKHDISDNPAELKGLVDNGYFFLLTVRNPFSRLVSTYRYMQVREKWPSKEHVQMHRDVAKLSFSEFVFDVDWAQSVYADSLITQATFRKAMPKCDLVIHLESFAQDVSRLPFAMKGPVRHTNVTTHAAWQSFYDEATAQRVQDYYAEDFGLFGYSQQDWKTT